MMLRILFSLSLLAACALSIRDEGDPSCRRRLFDLIFVIDGSRSVNKQNFETVKSYVKDFVEEYHVDPGWTRVAVIQYGSLIKEEISLGEYNDKTTLQDAISQIHYMDAGTMTGRALKHVALNMLNPDATSRQGRNSRSKTIVILLTDGRSQDSRYGTVSKYQQVIKNYGADLYVVAVGRNVNETELNEIASKPVSKYLHRYDKFGSISLKSLDIGEDVECDEDECATDTHGCVHICVNTFGSYKCDCEDGSYLNETDQRSCHGKIPPPPIQLEFDPVFVTSTNASWDVPRLDMYLEAVAYNVSYRRSSKRGGWKQVTVKGKSHHVAGLKPNTEYEYKVFSITENGEVSTTTRGTFKTAEVGRTSVKLVDPTSHSLTANWTVSGGPGITGYKLRYAKYLDNSTRDPNFKTMSRKLGPEISEHKIDNLEPNTYYDAWVLPMYGIQEGKLADHYGLKTTKLVPSVENLVVEEVTPRTAAIRWSLKGSGEKYEQVKTYVVKWWRVGARRRTIKKQTRRAEYTISNLRQGTEYMVSVAAAAKSGEISEEVTGKFVTGSNGDTKLRAQRPDFTSFHARWSVENPEHITGYELKYFETERGVNESKVMTFGPNTSKTTVRALKPGTRYTVILTPKIGTFNGKAVTKQISTVSLGSVDIEHIASSVSSITFRWAESRSLGLNGFEIRYIDSSTNEETSIIVDRDIHQHSLIDLQPGTAYTVMVTPLYGDDRGETETQVLRTDEPGDVILKIAEPKVTTLKVRWNMEENDENEITEYELALSSEGEENSRVFLFDSTVHDKTLKKLQPETDYTVAVTPIYGSVRGNTVYETATTASRGGVDLELAELTSESITSRWVVDDTDGLQNYRLIYRVTDDDKSEIELSMDDKTSEQTLDGLSPDTYYTVEVTPIYRRYDGRTSKKTIKTRPKRMADVENLTVEKLSETSVKLSWEFSGEGEEYQNITKSNISWKKKNTKKYNRNSTTDTSFVIEGLDPATEYVFRVDATGTSGTKSNTMKEFFTSGGTTVTKLRTKMYIVKITSTTITIRWIVTNNKGITGYNLVYYTIGDHPEDVQITEMDLAADVSEKTITGLESDSKVVVEVIPMYGEEEGSPASKTITTNAPEIPQPSNLQVKLTSSDTAKVDWETTVMSDEHERVAYFLVKLWRPEFPGYELEEEISDPELMLEGLKEDSIYTMSVEAVTETGERSEPLVESFETNARSDVIIEDNDRTSRSLDIAWEAEDDGSLTGFELEYRQANESELEFPEIKVLDAGARNWTIDYLEPGSSYVILLTPFYNGIAGKTTTLKTRTNQYFGPRVIDVRVKVISYTTAVVAWDVENGEDEMLYNIKVTSEYDEDMLIDEMTTNTSITLEGLQPYLDYKLEVTPWLEEESSGGSASGSGSLEEAAFTETAIFNTDLPSKLVGVKTTSLVALDQTPHSLTIKWDPDRDGQITQYRLNYSTVIDGNIEEIGMLELDEDVTLAVLNNLEPDTEYEIQLIPVLGEEEGAAITLNALTDGLKIPRLDGLHVTVTSPTTANAEWDVLGTSEEYEQVEKYQIMYRAHENKGPTVQEVTKDRFFNLSHMLVDQYYTITVDALTTDGKQLNTIRKAFKTDEAEKVVIEVDEMTTSQMLVRWSLENEEGVNRYMLSYHQADHPTDRASPIPIHGSTHERRLYRLEPNTTYTIQVAPMFGFEMGEPTVITATTPAFEPIELEEISANQTEIQMSWFVNDEAAIHVDGFDILYYPASDKDGSQRKMVHLAGEERETILSDLSPGVDYNVELTPIYVTGSIVADGVTVKRMVTTAEGPANTIPEGEKVRITNLKVTDVTIKSARFEWEVEGSNKSIDQVYYYFFTLSDGEGELVSHETEDNFYELDNLDPGFFYSVSVAAQTSKGLISPVNQQFQTNELEKVEIISVSSTSESITLEWKIAANIRPFLSEYEIVIDGVEDEAEAGSTYNVGPLDTELTVDNLQPGKSYTVLIVPIVTGWDAEETTVEVKTKKLAPSIGLVTVPQVSHTYANISWQVTSDKGYEEVSHYKVVVTNMDDHEVETFDISPDETSTRLNGLKPSTAYAVQISVVSENSDENEGSEVQFITLSLGRTSVELTDPSSDSMYVKWTTDNTDGLTAYSMTVTSVADGEIIEELSRMFLPGQTAATLTNLDPATMYQVEITPFFGNTNGTSGNTQLKTDKRMPELGNVEIDEITQQTATLSWEVVGTGPLFHQVTEAVYLLKEAGSSIEKTQTTKTTSVIFNELSPSTAYEYAVLLRTRTNETASVMGTFETLTFGEVNITSVKSELNSIQINWDRDDPTITNYELSYYAQRETGQQLDTEELKEKKIIIQGDQNSYVFDSLQPNTMYTLAITPIHDALTGITVSTSIQTEKLVPELHTAVANEVTPYSAELSWTVQPLNGSFDDIKHYAVQYNNIVAVGSDDAMDSVEFTLTDTSCKLSGLEPDTMYESSVNVVTESGKSSPAQRVEFTTNALSEPILDLDDAQLTSITAQWKMDGDEAGLTGYMLEYFQVDEDKLEQTGSAEIIVGTGKTKLFTSIEDEFVVEDLEPNTLYQFAITPKYGEHNGLKVKRELRTKKYVPSVSDVSVENVEDVTAVIAWNVSGVGEDFAEIQHFTVMRWKLGDERSLFISTESADQSEIELKNLEASTIYEVSVTLTTVDLEESKTIQTEFTTAPLRTANITSVQITQDSISLTFDVDKKEELSDVTIEYWDEDNEKHDELTLEKEIGLVKLEGLQPGAKYNVRLTPNYDEMRGATQELQVSTKKQLPQLVNFELSNLTQVGVHLKWDVNGTGRKFEHLRNYVVELGRPSTSFSPKTFETAERNILLEDLRPEERYIVNVYGEGEDGRRTLSTNQSFSTPSLGHTYTQVSNISGNSFMFHWGTIAAEGLTHHEIVMHKYDNGSGAYTESQRSFRVSANKTRRNFGRLEAATQYLVSITPVFFDQVKGFTVDTPVSTDKKLPNVHDLRFHGITHTSFNVSWDVESGPKFSEIRQFIIRVHNEGYGSSPEYYRPETFYIYSSDPNFDRKWHIVSDLPPSLNLTVTLLALTDEGYTNKISADVSTDSYSNIEFNITSLEPTSMNVVWKPVGGTGLTSYKLTYYPAECRSNPDYAPSCDKIGMFESFDLDTTEKNIVDLLPGEEYIVVVRPMHGQVRGAEFELRQIMPKRLPETTNFQVSSVGHKTAAFSWDVEGHGKEFEDVEEYKMSILEDDEQESIHHEQSMDGRKRTYEIKDLNEGTSYKVMLQGKTEDTDLIIQTATFNTKEMGELIMDLDKVTNSSISTKWSLRGSEELTGFKLKYYPLTEEQNEEEKSDNMYWMETIDLPMNSSEYTITGLKPGTLHAVSVTPVYLDQSEGLTIEEKRETDKLHPRASDLRVTHVNLTSAQLEWQMQDLSQDYDQVIHYEVLSQRMNDDGTTSDDQIHFNTVKGTSYLLEDLDPNSTYTVLVSAISSTANFSTPVTVTFNTGIIGTTEIDVKSQKHSSILVAWTRAPGSYLSKYLLKVEKDDFKQSIVQMHEIAENEIGYLVKDLEPDMKYRIEITPIYSWLEGKPSTARVSTTKVPVRVHKLRIVENGYTSAILAWNIDAPIDYLNKKEYEFKLSHFARSDPSEKRSEAFVKGVKNFTFEGLRPDTSYTVTIRALNVDEKLPIPYLTFTTKSIGYFDATSVNISSSEIYFSWRTSSLDLDDLIEIDVTLQEYGDIEVKRHLKIMPDSNPFKIDELKPGTTYVFDFTQKIKDLFDGKFAQGNSYRMRETTTRLVPKIKAISFNDMSRTSTTATWSLEDDKGPYVDDIFFVLKLRVVETDEIVKMFQHDSQEYMLTGLWPDTTYELNITVVSQFGRAKEFSETFTTLPTDAMELNLINPSKYSLTASWEPPEGLEVQTYELHYAEAPNPNVADPAVSIPEDQFIIQRFSGSRKQFTINDLLPGTYYYAKIYPMYKSLRGAAGDDVETTTKIFPHPHRIDNYNIGLYKASVKWEMDGDSSTSANITHFVLNLTSDKQDANSNETSNTFLTKERDFQFRNLEAFTRYQLTITPVTNDVVDAEEKERFTPPQITFYTLATGQHEMTLKHKGDDLIMRWRSYNAKPLTDYRIAVYGPFEDEPDIEVDNDEWKENKEAFVTMMEPEDNLYSVDDVTYFKWYVVELTPVFDDEDAPTIRKKIETVPNKEKMMPTMTSEVVNVTHSTVQVMWNISIGDRYLPIKEPIWIQYQPVGDPFNAKSYYIQLPATVEHLDELDTATDYEYKIWFLTDNGTVASHGMFTTLPETTIDVTLYDANITSIKVKWEANNLESLTGYLLQYKSAQSTVEEALESPVPQTLLFGRNETGTVLRNLEPGTHYQVRVEPLYGESRGKYEAIEIGSTEALRPPTLNVARNTNTRMKIWWRNYKNLTVDGYVIKIFPTKMGNFSENTRVIKMPGTAEKMLWIKRLMGIAYDIAIFSEVGYDFDKRISSGNNTVTAQPKTLGKPAFVKVDEHGAHTLTFQVKTFGYNVTGICIPIKNEVLEPKEAVIISELERSKVLMACNNLTSGIQYKILTHLHEGNKTSPAKVVKTKTNPIAPISFKLSESLMNSSTSLQAYWRAPKLSEDTEITYHLEYYPVNDVKMTKEVVIPADKRRKYTYTLSGLIPDESYVARLHAESSTGPKSHTIQLREKTLPEQINLKLESSDETFLNLSWTPTVFSQADSYEVILTPTDEEKGTVYQVPANVTNYVLRDLGRHELYGVKIRVVYTSDPPRKSETFGLSAITTVYLENVTNTTADLVWDYLNSSTSNVKFFISFKRGFENRKRYLGAITTPRYHLDGLKPNEEYALDVGVVYDKLVSAPVYTAFTTDSYNTKPSIIPMEEEDCSCSQMRNTQNRLWTKLTEQAQTIINLTRQLEEYQARLDKKKEREQRTRRTHF